MDSLALHQRLSAIACAFAAGLLSRQEVPAPHFHLPAAECPAPAACSAGGWSPATVLAVLLLGYALGVAWPPRACLRALALGLARLTGAPAAAGAGRRNSGHRPRPLQEGSLGEPRALFSD